MDAAEIRKIMTDSINRHNLNFPNYVDKKYDKMIKSIKYAAQNGLGNCYFSYEFFLDAPYDITELINLIVDRLKVNNYKVLTNNFNGWFKNKKPDYTRGFTVKW